MCSTIATQAQETPVGTSLPRKGALTGEELALLKEEEPVSIATRHEQPIFQAPANISCRRPPVRLDSDTLLNLRGGNRFWHDKAEIAVAVYNALDDRHTEYPLGNTLDSRVMGWVTVKFCVESDEVEVNKSHDATSCRTDYRLGRTAVTSARPPMLGQC